MIRLESKVGILGSDALRNGVGYGFSMVIRLAFVMIFRDWLH